MVVVVRSEDPVASVQERALLPFAASGGLVRFRYGPGHAEASCKGSFHAWKGVCYWTFVSPDWEGAPAIYSDDAHQ